MKKKHLLTFLILSVFTLFSCGSRKEIVYFQNQEELNTNFSQFIPKIQPHDQLVINIFAADLQSVAPFNQMSNIQSTNSPQGGGISPYSPTYTVNENGEISLPIIGNFKIAELTRSEAASLIKDKLSYYIKNPSVNINFANFRVTVLGAVTNPGSFIINSERVTLLEALGLAGDLTIQGKRENVIIIRELNGKKEQFIVDLTSQSAINSPVYYLAQNDVIYVEPNSAQVAASKFTPNYTLWISMAGIIISVLAVIVK